MAGNKNGKGGSGKQVKKTPTQYDPAESVEEIAKKLIPKFHTHLVNAKIAYLFINKEIKRKGKQVIATAETVSAKHQVLSGYQFVVTVAFPTYNSLTDKQKLAVIDHELEHCFVDDDEEGNPKYSILPHDVEEFSSIIKRHGLWTVDLARLGQLVEDCAIPSMKTDVVVKKVGDAKAAKKVQEEEEDEEIPADALADDEEDE